MKSRWYELKEEAIFLRKTGISIGEVERLTGISRSTLSGWFKNVKLTKKQKAKLLKSRLDALREARKKAVVSHNKLKSKRIKEAEESAKEIVKNISTENHTILELALAILYLGEGSKKNSETAIGSSDPMILKFFLVALRDVYKTDINKIRCELHLRADQSPYAMKVYWSKILRLPMNNFKQVSIDKRTKGKPTYAYYKGVCHIRYNNVALQRRLMAIANIFCKKVISINSLGV